MYMYAIYGVLIVLTVILLYAEGMPLFDSICHALGTAGTGGFRIKNAGVAFYNLAYVNGVVTVMILFGVDFNIFYADKALQRRWQKS